MRSTKRGEGLSGPSTAVRSEALVLRTWAVVHAALQSRRVRATVAALTCALGVLGTSLDARATLPGPTSVTATANSTSQITVSWTYGTAPVTGFVVERSLKAATGFKTVAKLGNLRAYVDRNLQVATTYYYRVRAQENGTFSRRSATVSATTFSAAAPTTPTHTATPTRTATPVRTATATATPIRTATATPVRTSTPVPTPTRTAVPTLAATTTPVRTATRTATPVRTATPLPTVTATPAPAATFDPLLVGFVPGLGAAQDVAVSGSTAFVASDTFGLSAVDVSVPSAPHVRGTSTRAFAGDRSVVRGTRAVVTGVENGFAHLWVLDVGGAEPVVVGELATTATAILDLAVNDGGTLAATAMGASGVWVIDLANPAAPVRRAVYDTPGTAFAVALNGTGSLAYVADGAGGLKVLSLANPSAPSLVGSLALSGIQRDLALQSSIVYLADQMGRLVTVDVGTPSAPRQLGAVVIGRYTFNVAVEGTRAVVHAADSLAYLEIVDVSAPANPILGGNVVVDAAGGIKGLALVGGRAYVANDAQGVKIYDLGSSPTLRSSVRDDFTAMHIAAAGGISVVTGADIPTNTARLQVVSTGDPTQPGVVGELPTTVTAAGIIDVAVNGSGTLAVTAMGTAGIWVIDLGNPAAPVRRAVYDTPGTAWAVTFNDSGSLVYVADGAGGLKILSLANPGAPVLVGSLAMSGIQRDIAVQGNVAYVADQMGRLVTVDVATPSAPHELGSVVLGRYTFNVAVDGTRAVLHSADSTAYLDVADVSVPASPVIRGSVAVDAAGGVKGLALAGGRAYLADGAKGLMIYSLANPAAPTLVGSGYTVGDAQGVIVGATMAQVADATSTISLIDLFTTP